jgi:hypothetical protein
MNGRMGHFAGGFYDVKHARVMRDHALFSQNCHCVKDARHIPSDGQDIDLPCEYYKNHKIAKRTERLCNRHSTVLF